MAIKNDKRTIRLFIRVTQSEYEAIKAKSVKAGLSLSEYSRRILLGETVVEAPPVDFILLIREVKRVGSNLNQVLKKINVLGVAHPQELERCADNILETMNLIYQTYRPTKGEK